MFYIKKKSTAKKAYLIVLGSGILSAAAAAVYLVLSLLQAQNVLPPILALIPGVSGVLVSLISKGHRYDIVLEMQIAKFREKCAAFHSFRDEFINGIIRKIDPQIYRSLFQNPVDERNAPLPVVPLIPTIRGIDRSLSIDEDLTEIDANFIDELRSVGKSITDKPTFRLLSIKTNRELQVGIGSYFKVLSSCDRFYYEMIKRFPLRPNPFSLWMYRRNKCFKQWRAVVLGMIRQHHFTTVSAGIGCSVLTVLNTGAGYQYLLTTNSDAKNASCDRHVIPSFMFQPATAGNFEMQEKELDLRLQVLREFGEEILGLEEFKEGYSSASLEAMVMGNEILRELSRLLREGTAVLRMTGLFLDVYRLRPEITCVLLIDEPGFVQKYFGEFRYNWETAEAGSGIHLIRLDDDAAYAGYLTDKNTPLCPPGAAALAVGRKAVLEMLRGRKAES